MAKGTLVCEQVNCRYYRRFYNTIKYNGAYVPDFNMTDERCAHPKTMIKTLERKDIDQVGVRLVSINNCPKLK